MAKKYKKRVMRQRDLSSEEPKTKKLDFAAVTEYLVWFTDLPFEIRRKLETENSERANRLIELCQKKR